MRIIGHIAHPVMKITVFVMDMKFAVKLEMGLMEQTYKLRESDHIKGLNDIVRLIDNTFLEACLQRFTAMQKDLMGTYGRLSEKDTLA
jgi:hypothetical protein